jgi:hypothetical protein
MVTNERQPADKTVRILGRALGVGVSTKGVSAYHRDPETGKIVWDDTPLEYVFTQRYDLSTRVWKSVEDMESSVIALLQGSIAMGETRLGTIKSLETYINHTDGGERVMGRWGKMFPNTPQGRREAWKREYLKFHDLQPGSEGAHAMLKTPEAKEWLEGMMAEKTQRGTPRLPDAVAQYSRRLGKAGLDYRVIRLERTTIAELLSDEKKETAMNSFVSTGKMEWVLERGRDHWSCRCEELAAGGPYDASDPRDKYGNPIDIPLHPNCSCMWRPILLSDDEVMKKFREAVGE